MATMKAFDPEKVERTTWWWQNGEYRVNRPNIDRMEAVSASDYDQLLELYREALSANKQLLHAVNELLTWRKNPVVFAFIED